MSKYLRKPIIVEAVKWNGWDDNNPDVYPVPCSVICPFYNEGETCASDVVCSPDLYVSKKLTRHMGWLKSGCVIYSGDYIITGVDGVKYPCSPKIFKEIYEPA